jgi:hypothetical protein
MNNQFFDDEVNKKIRNHESPVPPGTWDAIAQKKKKRRYPAFWWFTGVALLLGAGGFLTFFVSTEKSKQVISNTSVVKDEVQQAVPGRTSKQIDQKKNDDHTGINIASGVPLKPGTNSNSFPLAENGKNYKPKVNDSKKANENVSYNVASGKAKARIKPIKSEGAKVRRNQTPEINNYVAITSDVNNSIVQLPGVKDNLNLTEELLTKDENKNSFLLNEHIQEHLSIQKVLGKLKQNKFSIEFAFTPFLPVSANENLTSKIYTHNTSMRNEVYHADQVRSRFTSGLSYSIAIKKRVRPKLQVGAGVQYEIIKEKLDISGTKETTTYTEVQRLVNGTSGPMLVADTVQTISNGEFSIEALNSYRFLSIPVFINYDLIQVKGMTLSLTTGFYFNLTPQYNNSINRKLKLEDGAYSKNKAGFDLFGGLRLTKDFQRFQLFVEPAFRYNLTKYDQNNLGLQKRIHQARLSFGISSSLGR